MNAQIQVRLIGFGCGADQLTPQAAAALASCDYVIAARKREGDPLLAVRAELCAAAGVELVEVDDPERDRDDPRDYPGAVADWHAARAQAYAEVLAGRASRGLRTAGFLVWGDPAFYDSTIRILDRVRELLADTHVDSAELTYDVIPGVSAPQLLAAAHRIVLHQVGRPVLFTTGRRLAEDVATCDNLVVMLDGGLRCASLEDPSAWRIWWGANLGTDTEALVAGRLDEVLPEIRAAREGAAATAGWVMDTYLLRRVE